VFHIDLVEPLLEVQDFLGVQHDIGCLALKAAGGWCTMMREFGSEKRMS